MKKTLFVSLASLVLALSLSACGGAPAAETEEPAAETEMPAAETEMPAAETQTAAPTTAEPVRRDGERFEAVIILEGMEETVSYEHVVNETAGFEMDYDYESFVRHSETDLERFISIWDDPENPENYLEVTHSAEDADSVAAAVREALSQEYDLLEESRELDRAGSCTRIEASEIKGSGRMADQLQAVYIIPTSEGCLVATEHFAVEAAEGFGRRFSYMLHTLAAMEG